VGRARRGAYRRWLPAVFALLASAGWPTPTRADLVISAPNLSASPGDVADTFDLVLTDTDPAGTAAYHIQSFSIVLSLQGAAGVGFTDVTTATGPMSPYIFSPSFDDQNGLMLSDITPGTITLSFTAGDSQGGTTAAYQTVGPGQIFGLAHVTFAVDATAATGARALHFDPTGTNLSDENGNLITMSLTPSQDGSITVATGGGTVVTPEPSTLVTALTGVGAVLIAFLRRRSAIG
jgi:hypothetical protein